MKNIYQKKLFDSAKKAPIELSKAKVEEMIKGFPIAPPSSTPPSNGNNFTHFFSLNNLIMITIPIAIVAFLTLTNANNTSDFEATSIGNLSMEITEHKVPELEYQEADVIEKNKLPIVSKNNNKVNTKKSIVLKQRKRSKSVIRKSTSITPVAIEQTLSLNTDTKKSVNNNQFKEVQQKPDVAVTNSTADHLEAELGEAFKDKLNVKNKPESELNLDDFEEAPFSEPDELGELKEEKGVFTFASKVVRNSAIKPKGKAALFPVRVKDITMFMLHDELYEQLLLDNIIDAKDDFVVIQLPRYDIAINGKKLQVPLPEKYLNIIEAYKIKHGNRRVIILSQNTINIGDLVNNEFTGTSLVVD